VRLSDFTKPLHNRHDPTGALSVVLSMAITKPGLTVIAVLVALLWSCLIAERLIVQRANQEMGRALKTPARAPVTHPGTPHPKTETSERIGSPARFRTM
jgi:hypothetical protein